MFPYQGGYPCTTYYGMQSPPPQGILEESSTAKAVIGSRWDFGDREFVYTKAGAVALVAGKLTVMADAVANHCNIACVAGAASTGIGIAGSRRITVTLGATAATANQYAEGYLVFSDNGEEGTTLKIKKHPAADASATLTLDLYDALPATVAATHEVCLIKPLVKDVVISTTAQDEVCTGVPLIDITAAYYYWSQIKGIASVLADNTVHAIGVPCTFSAATGGAVGLYDAAAEPIIGRYSGIVAVSTEYRPIILQPMI